MEKELYQNYSPNIAEVCKKIQDLKVVTASVIIAAQHRSKRYSVYLKLHLIRNTQKL